MSEYWCRMIWRGYSFDYLVAACTRLSNSVLYSGILFAALDETAPSATSISCQTSYIQLPTGWILAQDSAASQGVIRAYTWGTHVMVVAGGNSYGTFLYTAGLFSPSMLMSDRAGWYKPSGCSLRVLIQCSEYGQGDSEGATTLSSVCAPCPPGSYSNATGVCLSTIHTYMPSYRHTHMHQHMQMQHMLTHGHRLSIIHCVCVYLCH